MAEEKKVEKKKKTSGGSKLPPINSNVVFFAILVIGIIIFTVILLLKPNKTIYRANLASNAEIIVQLDKKNVDIGIKVDGEVVSQEHGTYAKRPLESGVQEDPDAIEYIITFDNGEDEASMIIGEYELTLILADDTILVLQQDNPDGTTTTKITEKAEGK
jgi:hypothetical protein